MKTLKDAKVDDVVVVKRLHGEGPIKRRIMDMGITKGGFYHELFIQNKRHLFHNDRS